MTISLHSTNRTRRPRRRSTWIACKICQYEIAAVRNRIDQLESLRKQLDDPNLDTIDRLSLIASADQQTPAQLGEVGSPLPIASGSQSVAEQYEQQVMADSVVVPGLVAESQDWLKLETRERDLLKEKADLISQGFLPTAQRFIPINKELDPIQRNLEVDYQVARQRFDIIYGNLQGQLSDLTKQIPEYETVNRKHQKIQEAFDLQEAGQLAWNNLYHEAAATITERANTFDKEKVNLHYEQLTKLRRHRSRRTS